MAVTNVVARMYDAGESKLRTASPSEKGFDEVMNKAVEDDSKAVEKTDDREVCVRCVQARDLNPTLVSHKISSDEKEVSPESEKKSVDGTADVSEQDVQTSVAYRFSIFIRTSSDITSFGGALVDKFNEATSGFVKALYADKSYGVNTLDSYLSQASGAASKGESQTLSFVDQMLKAADNGLKAVTASMNSASVLNGFNLSMNSAMPGTNAADIARLYLQDAAEKSATGGSGITNLNPGRSGGLQLIRSEDLLSAPVKLSAADEAKPAVRDSIIEKFMAMLDEMRLGINGGVSSVKTEIHFSIAYGNRVAANADAGNSSENIVETMPETEDSGVDEVTA